MDTLIAITEAEDSDEFENEYEEEFNSENVDPDEEAIEEVVNEKENDRNFANAKEKLTFYFSTDFIQKAAKDFQKRSKELEKRKLPYWNM